MIVDKTSIEGRYRECQSRLFSRWVLDKDDEYVFSDFDHIFSFTLDDVACVYTFHRCYGKGTWFKLHDGSVCNDQGRRDVTIDLDGFV